MPRVVIPILQSGQSGARDRINQLISVFAALDDEVVALATALAQEQTARAAADDAEASARRAADATEASARWAADAALLPIADAADYWRPASRLAHEIAPALDGPYARPAAAAVVETERGSALRFEGAARLVAWRAVEARRSYGCRLVARRVADAPYAPAPSVALLAQWRYGAVAGEAVTLCVEPLADDWIEMTLCLDPPAGATGLRLVAAGNARLELLDLSLVAAGASFTAAVGSMRLDVVALAALGDAAPAGRVRLVFDAPGGPSLAVSDGLTWRQATLGPAL